MESGIMCAWLSPDSYQVCDLEKINHCYLPFPQIQREKSINRFVLI